MQNPMAHTKGLESLALGVISQCFTMEMVGPPGLEPGTLIGTALNFEVALWYVNTILNVGLF